MFDYYLCNESKKWVSWTEKLPRFELDPEIPLQVCMLKLKIVHQAINLSSYRAAVA